MFLSWGFNTFMGGFLWRNDKRTAFAIKSIFTVLGYGVAVTDGWLSEDGKIIYRPGLIFGKLRFERTSGGSITDWHGSSIRSLVESLKFWERPTKKAQYV